MGIKDRIDKLGVYFDSMNLSSENGIIYIRVKFPKGWGCSELTEYNYNTKCVQDDMPGYFYFFAGMEVGFDKVFDAIEYNIKFNEEAQAKVNLLREKIEELKSIFENEEIDVLKTLEFKLKKKKVKTTVKKNKTELTEKNDMGITVNASVLEKTSSSEEEINEFNKNTELC